MRFIVDFYRYAVLALLGLLIVGVVFVILHLTSGDAALAAYKAELWAAGIILTAVVVFSLGLIATFISLHDRHVELVDELREIRFLMENHRMSGNED